MPRAPPGMRPGRPPRRDADVRRPLWPPVAITLPDNLLGERVPVRFATGNAPVRGNPKGPVEVLYFTNLRCSETRMIVKGLLASHGEHSQAGGQGGARWALGPNERSFLRRAALLRPQPGQVLGVPRRHAGAGRRESDQARVEETATRSAWT